MMITGELEPSSMVTRLIPAAFEIASPTSREPVNEILRTRGSEARALPTTLPPPVMVWTASGGTPASSMISQRRSATTGVSEAGLLITALPAASAGPTLWQTRCSGKLNGVMAATTPQGTRIVNPNLSRTPGPPSSGITSEPSRLASSAER